MAKTATTPTDGIDVLKREVSRLPHGPGVYRMLGEHGAVLYVGKAKNIRNRVTQYTQPERMGARIRKMVFETRELVVVQTRTEAEAFLLEANLIKTLKPRYNILFRDDASYVSVVITDEDVPLIRSHRGARKMKGDYFGPYPSAHAVYQTLDLMERAFRLRTCSESVFRNRTRPCLKYDIKRCSGPCVGKVSSAAYAESVRDAKRFLRGERGAVVEAMQARMEEASAMQDYEQAAVLRDRIRAMRAVVTVNTAMSHALPDADVFALVREGGRVAVQAFYYRDGMHAGNHMFYPRHLHDVADGGDAEAMRLFLVTHYAEGSRGGRRVPRVVLCNVDPAEAETVAEALGLAAGYKVALSVPRRGVRYDVVKQAEDNARQALMRKVVEEDGWGEQMAAFGTLIGREVATVECYDISNISGKYPVASLVVAGREGMEKSRYRRYQIKTKDTPDDYAMLREVLTRRVAKGLKEGGLPDALLVDGGKGQLNVLVDVVRQAGLWGDKICPALCGIAKGEERDKGLEVIWLAHAEEGGVALRELPIAFNSPLKFLLQRVRDEAHRFAITYHREKRGKGLVQSRLDGIPGIGPKKKKALLIHFGSAAGVEGADVVALKQVPGVSPRLAQQIYDYFHA